MNHWQNIGLDIVKRVAFHLLPRHAPIWQKYDLEDFLVDEEDWMHLRRGSYQGTRFGVIVPPKSGSSNSEVPGRWLKAGSPTMRLCSAYRRRATKAHRLGIDGHQSADVQRELGEGLPVMWMIWSNLRFLTASRKSGSNTRYSRNNYAEESLNLKIT